MQWQAPTPPTHPPTHAASHALCTPLGSDLLHCSAAQLVPWGSDHHEFEGPKLHCRRGSWFARVPVYFCRSWSFDLLWQYCYCIGVHLRTRHHNFGSEHLRNVKTTARMSRVYSPQDSQSGPNIGSGPDDHHNNSWVPAALKSLPSFLLHPLDSRLDDFLSLSAQTSESIEI